MDMLQWSNTNRGTSEKSYSWTDEKPLHGPGQGARTASAIWTQVSTLITPLLNQKAPGITFADPSGNLKSTRILDGFVDDTTVWANNFQQLTDNSDKQMHLDEIVEGLQKTAQWWEELLYATGGKLELSKCFFYLLHWTFNDLGHPTLATPEEMRKEIKIRQSEDQLEVEITQKPCQEAHKTLGIMTKPIGDSEEEHARRKLKGKEIAKSVRKAPFSHYEADLYMRHSYNAQMNYGMVATTLSEKQLKDIESEAVNALLNKMGYNKNMPRAVVFGPIKHGGIGMPHMFTEQGAAQTTELLKHVRSDSPSGVMARIAINWYQLSTGVGFDTLEEPFYKIKHAEGLWINSIRKFLRKSGLSIRGMGALIAEKRRERDTILMDAIMLNKSIVEEDAQTINCCRLYLQVECLSDIATDGRNVDQSIFNKNEPMTTSRSHLVWPQQEKPGPKAWKIWIRIIKQMFCKNGGYQLITRLGNGQTRKIEHGIHTMIKTPS